MSPGSVYLVTCSESIQNHSSDIKKCRFVFISGTQGKNNNIYIYIYIYFFFYSPLKVLLKRKIKLAIFQWKRFINLRLTLIVNKNAYFPSKVVVIGAKSKVGRCVKKGNIEAARFSAELRTTRMTTRMTSHGWHHRSEGLFRLFRVYSKHQQFISFFTENV